MIKSHFEISVHASTYRKALAMVEQILMSYLALDTLEDLHQMVDIELKHVSAFDSVEEVKLVGFDVTAYVRLKKSA